MNEQRVGAVDSLRADVVLQVAQDAAFALFTLGFSSWWPREFSWSGADKLEDIGIEPRVGGFLYERGPHGLRLDWGRVIAWAPPEYLAFTWQIGPDRVPVPDPALATEVEVLFSPIDAGATRVEVVHSQWERHGDQGAQYRRDLSQAWPHALRRLATEPAPPYEAGMKTGSQKAGTDLDLLPSPPREPAGTPFG